MHDLLTIYVRSTTSTFPADLYVGINETARYGSPTGHVILPLTSGIVDTGTTLLYIATGMLDI